MTVKDLIKKLSEFDGDISVDLPVTYDISSMHQDLTGINNLISVCEKLLKELILSQQYNKATFERYDLLTRMLNDLNIRKMDIESHIKVWYENFAKDCRENGA